MKQNSTHALRRNGTFLAVFLLAASLAAPAAEGEDSAPIVLKGAAILTGDGRTIEDGSLIVKGGKILSMGKNLALPKGAKVVDYGTGIICPGLVDVYTALGAYTYSGSVPSTGNTETVNAVQPGVRALEMFNPSHDDFQDALACGITTVLLVPSADNVIGGCAAAVKTWCPTPEGRILRSCGPLVMTVSSKCFKSDRFPTSRIGAVDLLKGTLETAKQGSGNGPYPLLSGLLRDGHDGFFVSEGSYDLLTGLEIRKWYGSNLTLVGGNGADRVLSTLEGEKVPLVFGPFDLSTSERILRVPAAAAKAGIPVIFTSKCPVRSPVYLRITAALAVRAGLDREVALQAITSRAAAAAGISSRVGILAQGLDADLAVFSGHPVDLNSRLLALYVYGRKTGIPKAPAFDIGGEKP